MIERYHSTKEKISLHKIIVFLLSSLYKNKIHFSITIYIRLRIGFMKLNNEASEIGTNKK
jgi:hypothetical protein